MPAAQARKLGRQLRRAVGRGERAHDRNARRQGLCNIAWILFTPPMRCRQPPARPVLAASAILATSGAGHRQLRTLLAPRLGTPLCTAPTTRCRVARVPAWLLPTSARQRPSVPALLAGTLATTAACSNDCQTWGIGSGTQWDITKTFYRGVEVLYSTMTALRRRPGPGAPGLRVRQGPADREQRFQLDGQCSRSPRLPALIV
jgi:hypothetical protein